MRRFPTLLSLVATLLLLASAGTAGAQMNPCNPCGGKKAAKAHDAAAAAHAPAVNPCWAKAGTVFYIDDPMNRNTVSFESEAPLEDILGTSNQVHGYLVFNPEKPEKGVRGEIAVPVASLDTGIPLRDEHLRSAKWLDAASHPTITMTVQRARGIRVVKQRPDFTTWEMTVVGDFELHGKKKQLQIPVTLTYLKASDKTKQKLPGDLLAGRGSFQVALADYGIEGFEGVVGSKVSDSIEVSVRFMATNAKPEMAANPCGGKNKGAAHSHAH